MKNIIKILFVTLFIIPCILLADNGRGNVTCDKGDQDTLPPPKEQPPLGGDSVDIPPLASLDPNEIIGVKGYDSLRWVKISDQLAYTIYFENDPEFATAAAQIVEVRYAFDKKANMNSFGLGSFGFGSFVFEVEGAPTVYQKRLDVRDSLDIYVDVVAGLDVVKKEAFWIFSSIDPATGLPPLEVHKGFLPVNDKEIHNGEGFVSFVMKAKDNCVTGDSILAQASIVFDTNDAIETNVWRNTIDAKAPTSKLLATVDQSDNTQYQFNFEVADDKDGSGVKLVTVYLSQNKEAYKEYAVCTPDSILNFTAIGGSEYAFYSIAEDNTGNVEAQKEQPDYVINANMAPTDLSLSDTVFTDDITIDGFISELFTEDSEENQAFVYSLVEGEGAIHNDMFKVSGSQLQAGTLFKCADVTKYQIRLSTTDIGGLSFEKAFTLQLEKVLVKPEPDTISVQICEGESYDFYGMEYNQSGYYIYSKENEYSCDSIYVLDLRINPYPAKPLVTIEGSHTLVSSALSDNQWYNENGIIEEATDRSFTPTETGTYYVTTSNGTCESEASDKLFVNLSDQTELRWDLNKDWNWISVNTSGTTDAKTLFQPVKSNFEQLVGFNSELINDPTYGLTGSLNAMTALSSYKLNMKESTSLELSGPVCSTDNTIQLSKGWNWIGYLPIVNLNLETALSNLQAENGDVIKSQIDFSVYDGGKWTGTLTELKPGAGYMYSSLSAKEFKYSSIRVSTVSSSAMHAPTMGAFVSAWSYNPHKYPNNMNIIAQLYNEGIKPEVGIYTVGAFSGDECRGIGKYVDGTLFITVHGSEAGELISFVALENATNKEFRISESIRFNDALVGSLKQPYKLNVYGSTTMQSENVFLTIYPNPVRNKLFIGGDIPEIKTIQVLNAAGNIVLQSDLFIQDNGLDVSSLIEGTYILAIHTLDGIIYKKFIKAGIN